MSNNKDSFDLTSVTSRIYSNFLDEEGKKDMAIALRGLEHADFLNSWSPFVSKRVKVLREIQCEHDELEAQFFEERAALEAKYQKLYEPLYTKRYEIVNGVVKVEDSATDTAKIGEESSEDKGVPNFWLTAMKNNDILVDEISEHDVGALKFLKDIRFSKIDDPKGFKLEFFFDTNPYFKNSVLSKVYHVVDEDEPILEKAIGTEIEWHAGKCLTEKTVKKKPKKGSKNAKPITKTEKCDSFFNFFSPPEVPEDDEDMDEEAVEKLQNLMEADYDIGLTIKDKIIPHAVSWFTGDAIEFPEAEDEDGGDDDDDDDEDEEDDDEDEDEEDHTKNRTKKSGRAAAGDGPEGERPPECKQQ